MYTHTYEIRYGDYKDEDTVKPSSILDMVQDISTKHSEHCGYTMRRIIEMNKAWMLQGLDLRFFKPVSNKLPVTINTAIKDMKGVTSQRCCIIEQSGEVVAQTVANWFIFDLEKMRPARIPEQMAEEYEFGDFPDPFFDYRKPELREAPVLYSVHIGNKEIDTNHHLNNQKSSEILMDALPLDFFFTEMRVYFKKAVYHGAVLQLCATEIENGWYAHLQTPEGEICVAASFTK